MLDIAYIRQNKEKVEQAVKNKNVKVDLDELLKLDDERKERQTEIDKLRSEHQGLRGHIKDSGMVGEDIKAEGRKGREEIKRLEKELQPILEKRQSLLTRVPNIPTDDTPIGKDESGNQVTKTVGEKPKLEKPRPHWVLGEELDLLDFERAAKVSGSRLTYIKGSLVRLQFALIQFALEVLTQDQTLDKIAKDAGLNVSTKAFVPVLTPDIIQKEVFAKTGRAEPEEDKYWLQEDNQVLAGSAEHALAPMHMNEILAEQDLPLRYVGYSTNFRREAGSYGKDVRGILRQHQFDKLEMESFTTAESGLEEQNFLVAIQEYLVSQLGLPYQVVAICTGDMGKPDARQIDIETWMPGQDAYRETQTSDYITDFQARRLNIKYKTKDGGKQFVHMNDATAFAMGRTMIAIMENYQTKDGKVKIPDVLKPYMGGADYL